MLLLLFIFGNYYIVRGCLGPSIPIHHPFPTNNHPTNNHRIRTRRMFVVFVVDDDDDDTIVVLVITVINVTLASAIAMLAVIVSIAVLPARNSSWLLLRLLFLVVGLALVGCYCTVHGLHPARPLLVNSRNLKV